MYADHLDYRAVVYHSPAKDPLNGVRLMSDPMKGEAADKLLAELLAGSDTMLGGHLEVHVPGVGYVLADELDNVMHKCSDHVYREERGI